MRQSKIRNHRQGYGLLVRCIRGKKHRSEGGLEELQRVCACLTPPACGDVCVICVCLQERGRADGSIDHREYANHV